MNDAYMPFQRNPEGFIKWKSNSCYLNSVLNIFFENPKFVKAIMDYPYPDPIIDELKCIWYNLSKGKKFTQDLRQIILNMKPIPTEFNTWVAATKSATSTGTARDIELGLNLYLRKLKIHAINTQTILTVEVDAKSEKEISGFGSFSEDTLEIPKGEDIAKQIAQSFKPRINGLDEALFQQFSPDNDFLKLNTPLSGPTSIYKFKKTKPPDIITIETPSGPKQYILHTTRIYTGGHYYLRVNRTGEYWEINDLSDGQKKITSQQMHIYPSGTGPDQISYIAVDLAKEIYPGFEEYFQKLSADSKTVTVEVSPYREMAKFYAYCAPSPSFTLGCMAKQLKIPNADLTEIFSKYVPRELLEIKWDNVPSKPMPATASKPAVVDPPKPATAPIPAAKKPPEPLKPKPTATASKPGASNPAVKPTPAAVAAKPPEPPKPTAAAKPPVPPPKVGMPPPKPAAAAPIVSTPISSPPEPSVSVPPKATVDPPLKPAADVPPTPSPKVSASVPPKPAVAAPQPDPVHVAKAPELPKPVSDPVTIVPPVSPISTPEPGHVEDIDLLQKFTKILNDSIRSTFVPRIPRRQERAIRILLTALYDDGIDINPENLGLVEKFIQTAVNRLRENPDDDQQIHEIQNDFHGLINTLNPYIDENVFARLWHRFVDFLENIGILRGLETQELTQEFSKKPPIRERVEHFMKSTQPKFDDLPKTLFTTSATKTNLDAGMTFS